jgi:hypothetical protein
MNACSKLHVDQSPRSHCQPVGGLLFGGTAAARGIDEVQQMANGAKSSRSPSILPTRASLLVMQSAQLAVILRCRCAGIGSIEMEQFAGTVLDLAMSH